MGSENFTDQVRLRQLAKVDDIQLIANITSSFLPIYEISELC